MMRRRVLEQAKRRVEGACSRACERAEAPLSHAALLLRRRARSPAERGRGGALQGRVSGRVALLPLQLELLRAGGLVLGLVLVQCEEADGLLELGVAHAQGGELGAAEQEKFAVLGRDNGLSTRTGPRTGVVSDKQEE